MRLRLIVIALSIGLLLAGLSAAAASAQEFQYGRYAIEVALDREAHTLQGEQVVLYYNDGPHRLEAIYFLLWPNLGREPNPYLSPIIQDAQYWEGFDPAELEVLAVTDEEGQKLPWAYEAGPASFQTYSLERALLRVELPQALEPGAHVRVRIAFSTKFPHVLGPDEGYRNDIYTWRLGWNPVAIPARELIEGRYIDESRPYYKLEWPAAFYEVTLTVPQDFRVASGADLQEEVGRDEEAQTVTLHLKSEVPVRSMALSMGPRFKRYLLEHKEIPIEVYYLPGGEAAARLIASYAAESLDYYRRRWGAYGYRRLTLVASPAPGLFGLAADGLVILGDAAFSEVNLTVPGVLDRLLDYLVAHEVAHQWWGIGVGADFNAENFLSEAFAEYLAITYFEEKYGATGPNVIRFEREGLLEKAVESQFGYLNLRQHFSELPYLAMIKDRFDEALVKPFKDIQYANTYSVRIYNKGYLVLRALAGLVGQETMDAILSEAFQRFNHRVLTVADFQGLAEELSGRNLEEFFRSWVYDASTVDYRIQEVEELPPSESKPDEGEGEGDGEGDGDGDGDKPYHTRVRLAREGEARLPVTVQVVTETGEVLERVWEATDPQGELDFATADPVVEVHLDPESLTPDVNRLNNHYPTKVQVITDGHQDLPLDAYLIRFDPMAQIVEGGYLLDYRWLLGNGLIALVINQGRGNTLDAALALAGREVLAEFGWNLTRFSHPQIGYVAQFWEATDRLRLSLSRRPDEDAQAIHYLGLNYLHQESLRRDRAFQVSLAVDPFLAFGRLSVTGVERRRLWPHLYLDARASLGLSAGALPGTLRFTLDELNGFYEESEASQGQRVKVKLAFPGRFKFSARLAVSFPLRREMAYSLANLALIRQVRSVVYLAAGETWDPPRAFQWESLKLEVGQEFTASGDVLGGLLPFAVTVGVAYPLLGLPEGQTPSLQVYLGISTPLL